MDTTTTDRIIERIEECITRYQFQCDSFSNQIYDTLQTMEHYSVLAVKSRCEQLQQLEKNLRESAEALGAYRNALRIVNEETAQ